MATRRRAPGEDKPVSANSSQTVINAIRQYRIEGEEHRRLRLRKNKFNVDIFMGVQDWSHKQRGQSTEFLPKVPIAVEQFSAFIKRALTQFGDWFTVDLGRGPKLIEGHEIRALMMCYLDNLANNFREKIPFDVRMSDAIKQGLLEAVIILKIHGFKIPERAFFAERGEVLDSEGFATGQTETSLKKVEFKSWRLAIDLVNPRDFVMDPSGRGLYKIHRVERDLHDVQAMAEQGIYNKVAVDQIEADFARKDEEYDDARRRNRKDVKSPSFRRRVIIDEMWGDILDHRGHVVERNIVASLANDKFLIRDPEPNPNWSGEDPFVISPLIRVPETVWHKALYDHGSALNVALNELFNLMLDGGFAAVWGVRQLRLDGLEDPRQVSGGVPQGETLIVKSDFPTNQKIMETVTVGDVPRDALSIYLLADREFNSSVLTNDLKMGLLPPKQVKATEVIEASQAQAVTLDGITADTERLLLSPGLRKAWLAMLQNMDDLDSETVIAAIGPRAALTLARMSPAERFAAFAHTCQFKVHGLSATIARTKDFQKMMALFQAVQVNPVLLQAFLKRFSGDKALTHILKSLNINPNHIELDEDEKARLGETMKEIQGAASLLNGNAKGTGGSPTGNGPSAELTGEPELPAEINQQVNPLTGLAGAQ